MSFGVWEPGSRSGRKPGLRTPKGPGQIDGINIMKHRVLVLSASAGSGHLVAAQALERVFTQSEDVEAVIQKDALEFTNQAFRDFYSELYLTLVKRSPHFVGWWYDESDEPWRTDQVRSMMDRISLQPLTRFI